MRSKLKSYNNNVYVVESFWNKEICNTIINQVEKKGEFPEEEPVQIQKTLDDNLDSRDRFKVYLNNEELAGIIYEYLLPFFKNIFIETPMPTGLHPNLRVYKYLQGQEFLKHKDGGVSKSPSEQSRYSLLIYLNEDFEGGYTIFPDCEIEPKTGRVVFFPHEVEHSGSLVIGGQKYILRGNIMFKK